MFPPKKILFPVDFSEHCIGASRFVGAMTGRFRSRACAAPRTGTARVLRLPGNG
jgi:hypothetical protein